MDPLEIQTGHAPCGTVIWLHGLGADGHDFAPIVPELRLPPSLHIRFVFPHAPMMPVTVNGGYVMPAWYDVRNQDLRGDEDEQGIRASQQALDALIRLETARGIDPSRIVLAGFSQGGAIALYTALRYPAPLGGVLALSTYLPLPRTLAHEASSANAAVPIFMAHGNSDSVIPLTQGAASCGLLRQHGYTVEWREYPMIHSVCPREISDIGAWLAGVLG